MRCKACNYENRPGLRFCEQCGTPLVKAKPEGMQVCPRCGAKNPPGLRFCEQCAAPLVAEKPQAMQICPSCGAQNAPGLRFCEQCARPLEAAPDVMPRPRRRTVRSRIAGILGTRRRRLVALALVLLMLAPPLIYLRLLYVQRPSMPPPQVSKQEAIALAETKMREHASWFADVRPSVEAMEFGYDEGYIITYERDAQVSTDGELTTLKQVLIVSVNAMTGEVVVATYQ